MMRTHKAPLTCIFICSFEMNVDFDFELDLNSAFLSIPLLLKNLNATNLKEFKRFDYDRSRIKSTSKSRADN